MSATSHRPSRRVRSRGLASRHVAVLGVERMESRELLTLLGQQLFPSDNPWNQDIASAPVAANSTAVISNIISLYGNGRFHPDFGEDTRSDNPLYGIPINVVHGNSRPLVDVVIDDYPSESDIQGAPIPADAVLEGDGQDGPVLGLANRGDSHLIVWDVDRNIAYEFYRASRPSENPDGRWHADQESVWDLNTNSFRTLGWTSADAAGLPILPGLIRPDEALPVNQGGQGRIDHAIRITLRNNLILHKFLYPASHVANPGNTNAAVQVPMGARLRLKSSVNIAALNPQSRVVAQALQQYGAIVADNGSNFFATGASYAVDANNAFTVTWDDDDIQDSTRGLKSLRFSDFEVVDLAPAVTGLSAQSGAAGSTIVVNGSGFSGAAGRLQVLFGNTAAAGVNVLSDSQVSVTVPAGTGTVDVRVQSGVTSPTSQNINNPIFGYGISAVTPADRFTYGGAPPQNQAPTIALAAAATPDPNTRHLVGLSALGADDAGEANLVYSWQAVTSPDGASPTFGANGNNAAKNTTVTVNRTGVYTFRVTVTDQGGLSTTSSVSVPVKVPPEPPPSEPHPMPSANQAPTIARPAAASPGLVNGVATFLAVLGADDAGEANLTYTWRVIAGPGGAAPVFGANGNNAAKTTAVTFRRAGSYTFRVLVADGGGLRATSDVNVRVIAAFRRAVVVPAAVTVANRARRQFAARALDQFGQALAVQPEFTWSKLGGAGSISRSGLYTAPARGKTVAVVQARAGGHSARATVTVPRRVTAARRPASGAASVRMYPGGPRGS